MMRRASRRLEVRPLKRYREPGYPAAADFTGLANHPAAWSRPLTPVLASALAATAAASGCDRPPAAPPPSHPPEIPVVETTEEAAPVPVAVEPSAEPAPEPTAAPPTPEPALPTVDQAAIKALKGPFSWTASQLPIEWTPYGTGAPSHLSEDRARQVIERAFAAAGIRLRPNVPFQRPGISVELDGYDDAKAIGFEFVQWSDLEDPFGFRGSKQGELDKMLSHDEMMRIMEREKQGHEHIAIISYQDSRFSYLSYGPTPGTEADALRALTKQLNDYLRWLRSQGAL